VVAIGFALSSLVVAAYASSKALEVRESAAEFANGDPYCLQVASAQGGYRLARNWRDLSPLTMVSDGSDFHALLVVLRDGRLEIRNWSYYRGMFMPDAQKVQASGTRPRVCMPTSDGFTEAWASPEDFPVLVAGRWWRIPPDYAPSYPGGPNPHLAFHAVAPDFPPAPQGDARKDIRTLVTVELDAGLDLEQRDEGPFKSTLLRDEVGRVDTWTTCSDPGLRRLGRCQMRFVRAGREYSISLPPLPPSEWRRVQDNLVRRVVGFQVGAGS
jgi:hypothetical protein